MIFYVMAMLAAGLTISSMSGVEQAPCPLGTTAVNVTSAAGAQDLNDVLACTGPGSFNITWHGSLTIEQRIEVSGDKNVTVTGATFRGILDDALGEDRIVAAIVKGGNSSGLFYVSEGSYLRLNHMVLDGGNAENGGAVEVLSSSSLFVFGCTFRNNNASNGGEALLLT